MSEEKVKTEEITPQGSLRDVYFILFRHKWKMILFFLAVVVTVIVGSFCSARIYRSEAKLLVQLGRESVTLDPTATTGQIISVSQSREREIQTELAILNSQEIAKKAVDDIGVNVLLNRLDEEPPVNDTTPGAIGKVIQQFRLAIKRLRTRLEPPDMDSSLRDYDKAMRMVIKNLEIETQRDSSSINLAYESQSPKLAQEVLTKLIESYLERHIIVHQTPGSYEFFTRQSDDLRKKLANTENELRDYKNKIGIASPEEQRQVHLNHIGDLEQETGAAQAELAVSRAKVQALQKTLTNAPEAVATGASLSNYAADMMRTRLYELQLKEQDLVSKFTEESRQVQMIRQEVAEAEELLNKEKTQQVQSALLTEQATLSSLLAKVENLKGQLTDAQERLTTLNNADLTITQLVREIDIQKANYNKYSENLEQARIDDALENGRISNISIVQPATLPLEPVRPRKKLNVLLGLLLGAFGGLGLAFISEYFDHSIKTPDDAKNKLQLPILASIPRVRSNKVWKSPVEIRQHYEIFRERLLLSCNGSTKAPRVLAVVDCQRGEGAATVATNLAATLARHDDGPVLLVDADIGHPSLHRIFNMRVSPGFTGALADGECNEDAILSSSIHNLYVLSAGDTSANISEMFNSNTFSKLIKSMKNHYSMVVIDVPPAYEVSWAVRMAGLCDGVVMVIEAERLRWEVVQNAKEQLLNSKANILGAVLNKRRFYIPEWLYRTL